MATKTKKPPVKKFDVVAVDLNTNKVRVIDESGTEDDARAVVKMAVMRRGVDREFFATTAAGSYSENDDWEGPREHNAFVSSDEKAAVSP